MLNDKVICPEAEGKAHELADSIDKVNFIKEWTAKNNDFIDDKFGSDKVQFIHGILFTTSTSKDYAFRLKIVIQMDAAHMHFGKYTLYSAYESTANCNLLL